MTFAAVFIAFYVAHQVGDHWVQTPWQARNKGIGDWRGRVACLAHVATYTLTTIVFVALVVGAFALPVTVLGFVAGQLVSAVTHYWADRRTPLARLCAAVGKGDFYRLGSPREGRDDNLTLGTGAYALDQSWHYAWLLVAAMVTALA